MACVAMATFLAFARTTVIFDRELTELEEDLLKVVLKATIYDSVKMAPTGRQVNQVNYAPKTYWSHLSDAEAYVAVANGFNPAPISVTVEDMSFKDIV